MWQQYQFISRNYFWKQAPLSRMLPAYITGIICGNTLKCAPLYPAGLTLLLLISAMGFTLLPDAKRFRYYWLSGLNLMLLFMTLGCWKQTSSLPQNDPDWYGHYIAYDTLLVKISQPVSEKTKTRQTEATVYKQLRKGKWYPSGGKILLYFYKTDTARYPPQGAFLVMHKKLQHIKSNGNPGSFDYQRYCARRLLYHQVFLSPSDYIHTGITQITQWIGWIERLKQSVLHLLRTYIAAGEERGLAMALLIGYRNELDKTLVQAYSNTGVVHIIAISGLHLGLVYLLLSGLLKPLSGFRKMKILHLLLLLTGIWLFSLVSGASPSVLRAALMFSLMSMGTWVNRRFSGIHTLSVSAFLLLIINPLTLWDIGFQLSYAAVLGILLFHKPIEQLLTVNNHWIAKIWSLIALTLSAQVFTTPLVLYHFHQFSNVFILTNLIAVPFSSLILITEIVLCGFSVYPPAAVLLGKLVAMMIALLNQWIRIADQLPFAVTRNIPLSTTGMLLLMVQFALLGAFLIHKTKGWLKLWLGSALVFAAWRALTYTIAAQQQKIVVYQIPKKQSIELICGRKALYVGDSLSMKEHANTIAPAHTLFCINTRQSLSEAGNYPLIIKSREWTIAIVQENNWGLVPKKPMDVDVLIVTGKTAPPQAGILSYWNPKMVITASDMPLFRTEEWLNACRPLSLPCHCVSLDGALVYDCSPSSLFKF